MRQIVGIRRIQQLVDLLGVLVNLAEGNNVDGDVVLLQILAALLEPLGGKEERPFRTSDTMNFGTMGAMP
jgi:hypothetical protein